MMRLAQLIIGLYVVTVVDAFSGLPQFDSGWLPLEAQSNNCTLPIPHGLGQVPRLVDVQVKSVEEPNLGFIFKAIGNGERDDDHNETYGGAIYIYNDIDVVVFLPNKNNHYAVGSGINTGHWPYWFGPNMQTSRKVNVRVRCWLETELPVPCYVTSSAVFMKAGSQYLNETFLELHHQISKYPDIVKVRAHLTDGLDAGYYTDAQGTTLYNKCSGTSGLKFGFNDVTVRIWAPSGGNVLFTRHDGWGLIRWPATASSADVDVIAWCDVTDSDVFSQTIAFNNSFSGSAVEINVPETRVDLNNLLIYALIKVTTGPNEGFLFETVGSAMTNSLIPRPTCSYGGVVTAFNGSTLRMWHPTYLGAFVCIADSMDNGSYSQGAKEGEMIFRIMSTLIQVEDRKTQPTFVSSHYERFDDTTYNSTAVLTKFAASLLSCVSSCRQNNACALVTFSSIQVCKMYKVKDYAQMYHEVGTSLCSLTARLFH
ncbi:uncharacterized protein LOC127873619 [Dreissena polymorpha]|uniref:Apple domain-containing protein n=1 Tax=Dreissena polymorpha TaxID=45954 RepID=A0A9D4LDK9_DREPO|nr:uncharacterized protein LOC127873619 [Dreissena polymorpha]KAH3856146.1 hypothetical protein DPMN_098726 [Dreissena polymorpha]